MIANIDPIIEQLEYILENDQRTFSNPITDEDWFFDQIYEAYKILKNLDIRQHKNETKIS